MKQNINLKCSVQEWQICKKIMEMYPDESFECNDNIHEDKFIKVLMNLDMNLFNKDECRIILELQQIVIDACQERPF